MSFHSLTHNTCIYTLLPWPKKRQEEYLRMPVTTLLVRSRVLSRMVQIPLSWLQEINTPASSKLVFSLRRSHSGKTQSGPLVFLNPATGVVKELTFNTLALSSSYAVCVCAHVCFSSDRPTLKLKYYTLAAVEGMHTKLQKWPINKNCIQEYEMRSNESINKDMQPNLTVLFKSFFSFSKK